MMLLYLKFIWWRKERDGGGEGGWRGGLERWGEGEYENFEPPSDPHLKKIHPVV